MHNLKNIFDTGLTDQKHILLINRIIHLFNFI